MYRKEYLPSMEEEVFSFEEEVWKIWKKRIVCYQKLFQRYGFEVYLTLPMPKGRGFLLPAVA